MPDTIKDGSGSGFSAKVNGNNRLYANAVSISEDEDATKKGNSYNINTGVITLTNDTETPIIYFKNNEDTAYHITAIAVGIGPTTGGSGGIPKITVIRNPTGGTTITNENDVDINGNRNYGSSNTLNVLAYKGATGETMTGGTDHLLFFQTSSGRLFATIDEVVPKGSTLGVKFAPQTSNTSQNVYCALIGHLEDENE